MRYNTRWALILLLPVFLAAPPAAATTHVVNQVGLTFDPADITIAAGDTVKWVWSTGTHTVTNGASLSDPELGNAFDAPLDTGHRAFSHAFSSAGDVPYLCRFHASFGMTGIVHVQSPTGVPDTPIGARLVLRGIKPNPFSQSVEIEFSAPRSEWVALTIYSFDGRMIRTLTAAVVPAGPHRATWDGRDDQGSTVASGMYLARLASVDGVTARRITYIR